jgi:hypothetical protein
MRKPNRKRRGQAKILCTDQRTQRSQRHYTSPLPYTENHATTTTTTTTKKKYCIPDGQGQQWYVKMRSQTKLKKKNEQRESKREK